MGDFGEFKAHEAADLFPMLSQDKLQELADDIKEHGQLDPVEVLEGTDLIVDGRNRWRACELAGVKPRYTRIPMAQMPYGVYEYVIAKNLHRRQLTQDQMAAIAARALPKIQEEAKARQVASLKQNQPTDTVTPKSDSRNEGKSTQQAAEKFGTSRYKVEQAKNDTPVNAMGQYRAAVEAGDETAVKVAKALAALGLSIPTDVKAPKALLDVARGYNYVVLYWTLRVLRDAQIDKPFPAALLLSVATLLNTPGVDTKRLTSVIDKHWIEIRRSIHHSNGSWGARARLAYDLLGIYNKGLTANRVDPSTIRATKA